MTRMASSGTNSSTRSSHTSSTSDGAGISTIRSASSSARDSTMDTALGSPPSPVSTTRDRPTGLAGLALINSVISSGSRDAVHRNRPMTPARSPARPARWLWTASAIAALPGGNNAASSTSRANRGGIPKEPDARSSAALDTSDTLMVSDNRTKLFAHRTREDAMPYYRSVGEIPRKRHTQFRDPDGRLYAEELMGVEGFSSDSALLYHRHLPTAIVDAVAVDEPPMTPSPNLPLKPRHLKTHKLDVGAADVVTGRQLLLGNDDVRISYAV